MQTADAKFAIRQSEVASPGLFSDTELFKTHVGPTAKPSAQDKWAESAAALSKAVAACTKAAQKPAAKKPQAKQSSNKKTPDSKAGASTPGGRKRHQKNKSTTYPAKWPP